MPRSCVHCTFVLTFSFSYSSSVFLFAHGYILLSIPIKYKYLHATVLFKVFRSNTNSNMVSSH